MGDYQYYNDLLTLSYSEAVQYLISRYGKVRDNYFKEKSYARLLNGEIKTPSKGKYSRTKEGLYCHHIYENEYENLGNIEYIMYYKYPYQLQQRDNLVYCDLVEHLILHALIIKETNSEFGKWGFEVFIRQEVEDYYIEGRRKPKLEWRAAVFERSFLFKDEATKLLKNIDIMLLGHGDNGAKFRIEHEQEEMERKKKQLHKKNIEFNTKYPNLKSRDVTFETSRKDIVKQLQATDFEGQNLPFKKYYMNLSHLTKDELLEKLDKVTYAMENH